MIIERIPTLDGCTLHWLLNFVIRVTCVVMMMIRPGIVLTAHSSLGSPGSPAGQLEGASLLTDDIVNTIAGEVSRSPAQVLLRWAVQKGVSVCPTPGPCSE